MSATKFTPGPWRVHVDSRSGIGRTSAVYVCTDGEWPDAQVARVSAMDGYDEREANALLLAAAPDFAEAAQEVLAHRESDLPGKGWLRDTDQSRAALAKLAAALAKATGARS